MENNGAYRGFDEQKKFSSPEEELKYLREAVAHKESAMWQEQTAPSNKTEAAISATITEYGKEIPQTKLEEHLILENPQFETVVEHISSLPHREKMREIYQVLAEKGVLSAVKLSQALGNPHIEDDFHRVLVEYVRTGAIVPGLEKERDLSKLLHMEVYEVTLPFAGMQEGDKALSFKEVILEMERFYLGMIPLEGASKSQYGHFSLELVLSNFSNDIVFYIAVEEHMKDLFVKQILGAFPTAKIEEHPGDYNIFNEFGAAVGSYAEVTNSFVYPIKMPDDSDQDPFAVILNSFTKIERDGEGAALQFIISPDSDRVVNKVKHALGQIKQGVPVKRATDIPLSAGGAIVKTFSEFFNTQIKGQKKDNTPDLKEADAAQKATALMEEKIGSPLLFANLRLVVSAPTRERAEAIRLSIESAFNQFSRPQANGIKFTHADKARLSTLLHNFTYREADDSEAIVFNTKELATLYHLPAGMSQKDAPQLKTVKASSAPAPADLPHDGTLLGINKYRGESREIRMTKADRVRHLYVLGQTGTGKTTLLKNMIVEDIKAGKGVCFIDPHGSDVQDILANIPKERIDDVIYFDPSYTPRPFALNMLEYDPTHPEQKIFVVNELLSIFKKLYASTPEAMGPAFEQYFRNATMLVMEDPETGNTMLEIPRVLADATFRNLKISRCKNPIVVQFWRDIAAKSTGEASLANMVPYITNKFDVFLSNDVVRPIIAQEKSSFNFRDIMDNKKIILVNLAKGKLGEMNANLIGLVLVGKILMAALSRVDSFGTQLPDFYLYIDEFQNISTDSISSILSEARKYGLSLNIAHQFIAQLDPGIKDAVFGNVGSMAVFRVGADDAQFLESQFAPIFKASDIMKIDNHNAYLKMLINGKPVPPFNIETMPPPTGTPEVVEQIKNLSYLKFGKDRKTVDDAIMKKYLTAAPSPAVQAGLAPTLPATLPITASVAIPPPPAQRPIVASIPNMQQIISPPAQAAPSTQAQQPVPAQSPLQNQFIQAFAGLQQSLPTPPVQDVPPMIVPQAETLSQQEPITPASNSQIIPEAPLLGIVTPPQSAPSTFTAQSSVPPASHIVFEPHHEAFVAPPPAPPARTLQSEETKAVSAPIADLPPSMANVVEHAASLPPVAPDLKRMSASGAIVTGIQADPYRESV